MVAANQPLELRDYPLQPTPCAAEVLVRVSLCTICASDLHTWQGRRPADGELILGHEITGRVAAIGPDGVVDLSGLPLSIGDRVTWTLHSSCGKCTACHDWGLPMKCRDLRKYGHDDCREPPHLRGGFAEYVVLDGNTDIVRLPDSLPDAAAAPVNCATATAVAACEAAALVTGQTVLIQGAGALGHYAAAYARERGCQAVIVSDPHMMRRDGCQRFGATHAVGCDNLPATVRQIVGSDGVDAVLEFAGVPAAVPAGLACLRPGGAYIACGCVFPNAHARLDLSILTRRRLRLVGVHNYASAQLSEAVAFLERTQAHYAWHDLVGATYRLDQVDVALTEASKGEAVRIAVNPEAGPESRSE